MSETEKQVVSAGYHCPVCKKCHVELRPETNGVGVLDLASFGPAQIWAADLWKCPGCGIEIVGGFGRGPISEHYEPDFETHVKGYRDKGLLIENQER